LKRESNHEHVQQLTYNKSSATAEMATQCYHNSNSEKMRLGQFRGKIRTKAHIRGHESYIAKH